jgi:RAI1 like PD-(D/E)XK nuclease
VGQPRELSCFAVTTDGEVLLPGGARDPRGFLRHLRIPSAPSGSSGTSNLSSEASDGVGGGLIASLSTVFQEDARGLDLDLCEGFDPKERVDLESGPLPCETILSACAASGKIVSRFTPNRSKPENDRGEPVNADVVSFRNNFNKLLATPYQLNSPWEIIVSKRDWDGLLVLEVSEVEEEQNSGSHGYSGVSEEGVPLSSELWQSIGYRLEDYVVDQPSRVPVVESSSSAPTPATHREQFVTVVATAIGAHRVILGAEIDCQDENGYVEVKSAQELQTSRIEHSFLRFKVLDQLVVISHFLFCSLPLVLRSCCATTPLSS